MTSLVMGVIGGGNVETSGRVQLRTLMASEPEFRGAPGRDRTLL